MNSWIKLLTVGSMAFVAGKWPQDASKKNDSPAIEAFVYSDFPLGPRDPEEPWVVEPSSHQLQWGTADVILKDVLRSGNELALTIWTGMEGYENNVVTLRFAFDPSDPRRPRVEASVHWSSCTGGGHFEEPRGNIRIWPRDNRAWDGRTAARITYALYDTVYGAPDCVHGEIEFDPADVR
jgi:hypothetical protein